MSIAALALALALATAPGTNKANMTPPPRPSVVVGPIAATDVEAGTGRSAASLALELEAQRPAMSACVTDALSTATKDASKEHTLTITVYLKDDGTLTGVDGPPDQKALVSCLRGTLGAVQFSWDSAKLQTLRVKLRAAHGPALTRGTIAREAMNGVVKEHMADVQKCYAAHKSAGDGDVTVQWLVEPDAKILNVVAVGAPAPLWPVGDCLEQKAAAWKLPKPTGGRAVVKFPFHFERAKKTAPAP